VKIHAVPSVDRASGSGFDFFDTEGRLIQLYTPEIMNLGKPRREQMELPRGDSSAARSNAFLEIN
jgi:hypothetical protein